MGFGFGRLPALPAGLTQQDFEALLAAAPPGASTMGRPGPFNLSNLLAAPTGAPMGMPGAPADETMGAPSPFGDASAQSSITTPGGVTLPGPPPGDKPAPHSIFGDARREAASQTAPRPLSFGPLSPQPEMPPMSPGVSAADFDRRFDAAPPGEGYGLNASAADALRAGLMRRGAPSADMPAPDAVPASGGAPAPSFAVPALRSPAPMSISPPAVAASPASPTPAQGQADDGGFDLGKLVDAGRRNGAFDLMQSLGIGLMTTRGVGPALAAGLKLDQDQQGKRAVTQLAQAEFGLKARKANDEVSSRNATAAFIKGKLPNIPDEQALALAGNSAFTSELFKGALPPSEIYKQFTDDKGNIWNQNSRTGQATVALQAKEDKTVTALTDPEARAAAGIAPNDRRSAWKDADGKVTFNDGPKAQTATMIGPDGTKATRVYNPATGAFDAPDYGGSPPRSSLDTTGIPAGVDPATYRKELAKATVQEQRGASQRATQASNAVSVLDRAERAYSRLAQNGGIGPIAASGPNRLLTGAFGAQNEVDRQEFEAASKDLELLKAQISMKGQGSITDSERRLLAHTLPRLDAASPETGLTTLRQMRDQFTRSMSADRLPSYGAGRADPGAPSASVTPAQPSRDTLEAEARRRGLIR